MTNTELLKQKIEESGIKLGVIAEKLGIVRSSLWSKINGKTQFNQYEINKLCELLNIKTLANKEAIFFAKDVN